MVVFWILLIAIGVAAIALAPKDAKSYHHLGLALRQRQRIEEAITALERAEL